VSLEHRSRVDREHGLCLISIRPRVQQNIQVIFGQPEEDSPIQELVPPRGSHSVGEAAVKQIGTQRLLVAYNGLAQTILSECHGLWSPLGFDDPTFFAIDSKQVEKRGR
jgi:hypothetical protein